MYIQTLAFSGFILSTSFTTAALILNAPMPITHQIFINPIIAQQDDGTNPATFLGTTAQEAAIKGFVDDIWAQAGIDVEWLTPTTINSTEILQGTLDPRPQSDLSSDPVVSHRAIADNLGLTIRDGKTINMYFVDIAAGHGSYGDNTSAGLAELPSVGGFGDDTSMYVGVNLPGFVGGQEVVASVIAHEIGHNLSLDHLDATPENLLQPGGSPDQGERLNASQISDALMSSGLTAIPEPSSALLLGLSGIVILRRRR